MCIVYLARDPFIKRPVAIKRAFSDTAKDPKTLARLQQQFFNEAQTAGKLDHPHIVSGGTWGHGAPMKLCVSYSIKL